MRLATRIALLTGSLAAATALASGAAAWRVINSRLDAELERSFDVATDRFDDPRGLEGFCNLDNDGRPRGPRPRPGVGREVVINCLDLSGQLLGEPDEVIPLSDTMKSYVREASPAERLETRVEINKETHRVRMVSTTQRTGAVRTVVLARSVEEQLRLQSSLFTRLIGITLLGAAGASMIGWWLARRLSQPLRQLTVAASQITESGDLTTTIEVPNSQGEVEELSTSFSAMVASLRESKEAQARLVQDAGHELRTPLTSLRMNVEMLSRGGLSDDRRNRIASDTRSELEELTALTNELIEVAGAASTTEAAVPVDIRRLLDDCVSRWRRRSDRTISVNDLLLPAPTTDSAGPMVTIGPIGLMRAIDNLIGNAIKFSPADSPVDITLDMLGSQVRVTVADHGPGISEHDMPFVFDRFFRSESARSTSGSGLGLSIARDLTTAAGGTITAGNKATGGALFEIILPLSNELRRIGESQR
jgi:two-component system, OmpR family, sensor histidine kinase MprB